MVIEVTMEAVVEVEIVMIGMVVIVAGVWVKVVVVIAVMLDVGSSSYCGGV